MSAPVINLQNISFNRKDSRILSSVCWKIEQDQDWALIGANGSGKTTLLKIITGYEWPSEGFVQVLGNDYGQCSLGILRRTIGWVSSAIQTQVPGWQTATEAVLSGIDASVGTYREFSCMEKQQAQQLLQSTGLAECKDKRYGILSQGQQQRVLIARAMINDPKLLILDEPCVGLDPAARHSFLSDMQNTAGQKASPPIIYVTHHIEEIGRWIDNVIILKEGMVIACGKKESVLTSETLSQAFDCCCSVETEDGIYRMKIETDK